MNHLKTFLLLAILTLLLIWIGGFFGGRNGALMAFIFTLCMNSIFYFFSDRIVLNMYRAEEIPPEELPWLHNIVEDLAQRMGIPKPRVYLIPHPSPNAFATGRSPSCAAVAVTQGLLKLLNPEEIKGVIGHELSHIKHRDTLIQTVAVSVAGAISMLAYWLRWRAIFGDDDERGVSPFFLLMVSILAPIAALIVQMSISRTREYLADEGGARACGNPLYLANALRKLASYTQRIPLDTNPSTAPLFIVHPFSSEDWIANLFSTHPPIEERIRRLELMAREEGGGYVF